MLNENINNSDLETLKYTYNKQLNSLNNENVNLNKEINNLSDKLHLANKKIEELSLLLAMGKARTFSKKQETIDKEEINLFNYNEVEKLSEITIDEAKTELITKKPNKKAKNHSKIDFEKFVTNTIVHDPANGDLEKFTNISEDITYKAHVSINIEVTKHIFKTVKNKETNELLSDPRNHVFPNSIATPSLVSFIANEKYLMATPLYRQESAFLSMGFPLSRVNMSNMLTRGAALLYPFYEYLKHLLINNEKSVLHADETTLKVINVGDKAKKDKCYIWLYTTSMFDLPIYLYEYKYSRQGIWPREFLKDYKGYLVTDDYQGYNHIPNVVLQKCFTHARRKFFDIYKANKDPKIKAIIEMIDDIYRLERKFRDNNLESDEIYQSRNSESYLKVVNTYFNHLTSLNYAPTSITSKAINYSLKNKRELLTYLKDGNIPIDNNLAERGIKPFVINRKNFLFSNTEKGAIASTVYMSVIQTAKTNGLDTNKYLEYLFDELHKLNVINLNLDNNKEKTKAFDLLKDLVPWNNEIKYRFKMKEVSR